MGEYDDELIGYKRKRNTGVYWDEYYDMISQPFGIGLFYDVDVSSEFEHYLLLEKSKDETPANFSEYVNFKGPFWEYKCNNTSTSEKVSKVATGAFIMLSLMEPMAIAGDSMILASYSTKIQAASRVKIMAKDITFSDKFSKPGYVTQVAERGWTNGSIANTINNPCKIGASINTHTGNKVAVYFCNKVHYVAVAVDVGTGKVIQVADLSDPAWVLNLLK